MSKGRMVYVRSVGKTSAQRGGHWHEKVKLQAVEMILAGKTSRETSMMLKVPFQTVCRWRSQDWFKDLQREIQEDDGNALDSKLTKILHNSLEAVQDRLDNGDHIRDEKTGKVVRVPVKIRDATNAFNILMDKRQLIRKMPTKIADNSTVNQQLQVLATEFKKFLGHKEQSPALNNIVEGEHVFINEDGTGEWIDGPVDDRVG